VSSIAEHNVIYGSVSATIVLLLWFCSSAQIFLLGAEFTAEYRSWRRAGKPLETRPLTEWMDGWSPTREMEMSE
jgi:uncharacterized BrkB/YihY/UPF0761 family membrane protein